MPPSPFLCPGPSRRRPSSDASLRGGGRAVTPTDDGFLDDDDAGGRPSVQRPQRGGGRGLHRDEIDDDEIVVGEGRRRERGSLYWGLRHCVEEGAVAEGGTQSCARFTAPLRKPSRASAGVPALAGGYASFFPLHRTLPPPSLMSLCWCACLVQATGDEGPGSVAGGRPSSAGRRRTRAAPAAKRMRLDSDDEAGGGGGGKGGAAEAGGLSVCAGNK